MSIAYSLFIKCEIDGIQQYLGLDYVDDNSQINVSSDITTHPLVNGDIIADHMYINASTISFNGTFSLVGNKKGITYITENKKEVVSDYSTDSHSRLAMIEQLFERINKEGILCELVRRSEEGEEVRFLTRKNMALTSITWTEHQYSVDFNFGFTEALTAIVEEEIYESDIQDEDLPILTSPQAANLSDNFINKQELKEIITNVIKGIELESESLFNMKQAWKFLTINSLQELLDFFNFNDIKMRNKLKKLRKNVSEDEIDKITDKILEKFDLLEQKISLYTFGQNISQQCLITIDNVLYCFTLTQDSKNSDYSLSVTHLTNLSTEITDEIITNIYEKSISSLNNCNDNTILFKTDKNTQIYLVNLYNANTMYDKVVNLREMEDKEDKASKILTNYGIIISTLDLYKYREILNTMIQEVFSEIEL